MDRVAFRRLDGIGEFGASGAVRVIGAIIGDPSGLMAGMSGHVIVTPP